MITDIDQFGNITISELTPQEAMAIQSALLHVVNKDQNTTLDNFLRRVAMQIDAHLKTQQR